MRPSRCAALESEHEQKLLEAEQAAADVEIVVLDESDGGPGWEMDP
jgi:hypothetical protein